MIILLRAIILFVWSILLFVFGSIYCLFSPRNPEHVYRFSRYFAKLSTLFGIKLELRKFNNSNPAGQNIIIGNHQSNWDMVTISAAVTPKVVTVGKRSLAYIPLFGFFYWLTGNILIDRADKSKAFNTIDQIVNNINNTDVSVWMFPEGTRSRGRGLLPFKSGAFYAAIAAQVPVVPIVCSTTDKLGVNRWNNGHVIVEMLEPIPTKGYKKEDVRKLMNECHQLMQQKLIELDAKVAQKNKADGIVLK